MPVMRFVKRYNKKSVLNGIVAEDKITFATRQDGAKWVLAVNEGKITDFEVVDYEWALVDNAAGENVIEAPSGFRGRMDY